MMHTGQTNQNWEQGPVTIRALRSLPQQAFAAVRDAIYTVTKTVLEQPDMQEKLKAQGLTVQTEAPDAFGARIKRETEMWAKVIRARNISIQ